MKSKSYFLQLYCANKCLFFVVFSFAALNLSANFIFKAEHTPVFVWDLYAYEIPQQLSYSFLEIRYNDNKILSFPHTWDEPQKLFFINTIDYFIAMKRNHNMDPLKVYIDNWNKNHPLFKSMFPGLRLYNDSNELKKFPDWYKRYLEQYLNSHVYKINVYEVEIAYQNNGEVKALSSTLIYELL